MDVKRVNVYNRLRDFGVPSTVLDNIFKDNNDAQVLINAFEALIEDGHSEDESAKEISEMRQDIKALRADMNKGKGAVNVLIFLAGLVVAVAGYFKLNG